MNEISSYNHNHRIISNIFYFSQIIIKGKKQAKSKAVVLKTLEEDADNTAVGGGGGVTVDSVSQSPIQPSILHCCIFSRL